MSETILKVAGLKKIFQKDGQEVHVLKGIDFTADKGALRRF